VRKPAGRPQPPSLATIRRARGDIHLVSQRVKATSEGICMGVSSGFARKMCRVPPPG
jgi:hypothetical protein